MKNDASTATKSNNKTNNDNNQEEEDDDDMISLDDLQCCICFVGDASDENDVILCDGENCFRAYHMNCVSPHVTLEQVEEEDDWFCPICTAMAKLIANIQSEYTGDDWQADNDDAYHYSFVGSSKRRISRSRKGIRNGNQVERGTAGCGNGSLYFNCFGHVN